MIANSLFHRLLSWLQAHLNVRRLSATMPFSLNAAAIGPAQQTRRNSLTAEGPTVYIWPDTFAKLQAYIGECPDEISGFGLVKVENGDLVITEILLPEQTCTCASTEISEERLSRFLNELIEAGGDPGQLHLYWHSHADMAVFLSTTDLQTMETAFPYAGWVLSLVLNRRGDMKAYLNLYQPVSVCLHDLPIQLYVPPEVREAIKAEITQKVRRLYYTPRAAYYEDGTATIHRRG